jgi:hypothetical protein
VLRRRKDPPPPPDPLAEVDVAAAPRRFSGAVAAALDARRRYGEIVASTKPGPVRDQLTALSARVDEGVAAVWSTVTRAGEVERTLAALDPDRVTWEYKDAKRNGADEELVAVLHQRFTSVQRLLNSLDDTDARLRLLDARLGAAVARAAEVSVSASGDGTAAVAAELDGVVTGLTTLRAALDELA